MNLPIVSTQILGTGSYLPERCVKNSELTSSVGLDEAAIEQRTGIRERHWAAKEEAASDLAVQAAQAALLMADGSPAELQAIILSTTSPDMPAFPATACLIQERLGAKKAVGFDVAASCGGFLVALSVGLQWIASGQARSVLVVASEVKSRFVDLRDPATAILFGDGAGAVLLGSGGPPQADGHAVLCVKLHSDGSRAHLIRLPAGGSRMPISPSTLSQGLHTLRMNGGAIFRAAVRRLESVTREVLKEQGLEITDIHHFVYHQANARILSALARRLSIPSDRLVTTLSYTGNTSSASLPIALDHLVRSGRLKKEERIFLGAFGGGLNWGGALIRW
ncbi:MAG TPA: beta-ketoacyl-ACP synthase III [Nitrospiria bacterium]|nr:beta-ketoacyl-ACP synthase III [Nitrospiria bacterium]